MRLIDADKLRNQLFGNPYADVHDFIDMIHDIPTENAWIPCSERLPEMAGRYLISRTDYDGVNDKIVKLVDVFDFDTENRYDAGFFATEVDAWQPLPEPWERAVK